jgi:hypothetical protein
MGKSGSNGTSATSGSSGKSYGGNPEPNKSGTSGTSGTTGGKGVDGQNGATGANGSSGSSGTSGELGGGGTPFIDYADQNMYPCAGYGGNTVNKSENTLLSGGANYICLACCSADTLYNNFIGGGYLNGILLDIPVADISPVVQSNAIGGGESNCIWNCGISNDVVCSNAILGGLLNGMGNCIGGKAYGLGNIISNAIGGGHLNKIEVNTSCSAILGGCGSTMVDSVVTSVIGGSNITITDSCRTQFDAIAKISTNFAIKHPDPQKHNTWQLRHALVESPTAGDNIYRYKVKTTNCQAFVELPSYYKFLNEFDQVWVSPTDHLGKAWGCVNNEQTHVEVNSNTDGDYYVLIVGTRKDECAKKFWQGTEHYSVPTHIVDY